MNEARIQRMLRELHSGPPLRFLEDLFALGQVGLSLASDLRLRDVAARSLPDDDEVLSAHA